MRFSPIRSSQEAHQRFRLTQLVVRHPAIRPLPAASDRSHVRSIPADDSGPGRTHRASQERGTNLAQPTGGRHGGHESGCGRGPSFPKKGMDPRHPKTGWNRRSWVKVTFPYAPSSLNLKKRSDHPCPLFPAFLLSGLRPVLFNRIPAIINRTACIVAFTDRFSICAVIVIMLPIARIAHAG